LTPDAAQIYHRLLTQELAILDSSIALGRAWFDSHQFDKEVDLTRRRTNIEIALTPLAIAATGLTSEARQFYESLLTKAKSAVDKAIADLPPPPEPRHLMLSRL